MARIEHVRPPRRGLRLLRLLVLLGLVSAAIGVASIAAVFWVYGRDKRLPDIQKLADYTPKQVTVILDSKGRRVGELFDERRTYVPYDKIPGFVVDCFIAAEDQAFWTHTGIDYVGMARAFFVNLRSGKTKQGASTITQQVVKTFLLTPERTFKRKIQEVILARRLEGSLTKQEIMTLYLNQIYFAHGRYGVQEAARYYFGKDVEDLNLGEAALLGGMPKSPENISPRKNPERAKERQTYVLNNLAATGKITRAEAKKWIDAPIQIVNEPFADLGSAPEWVDLVRRELVAEHGEDAIATLGAEVRTTLEPKTQTLAHRALQKALREVDRRQKVGLKIRHVEPSGVQAEIGRLRRHLPKSGPQAKQTYEAVVTAVHNDDAELAVDLGGYQAAVALAGEDDARMNPPDASGKGKSPAQRFAVGDVVRVMLPARESASAGQEPGAGAVKIKHAEHRVALAPGPEGAVVVIDVKTRKVRALVGGYASKIGGFNRATMAKRQPGSSFKPFVFAAAVDAGKATGARLMNDAPAVYDLWKPKNYARGSYEGPILARRALAKSINTVAIQLCHDVGPEAVVDLAHKMGIGSELPREMSISLGSGEVTPLEHTNALATLAAGGTAAAPRFIESIDGKAKAGAAATEALRPEVAYVVLDMMRSVVQEGTATAAKPLGAYVAGKTGTSNDARDTWFVGLTADYAIGVWIGYDDPREMKGETGGKAAVPVFIEVARGLGTGGAPFPRPDRVVEVAIDKATGLLSSPEAAKGSSYNEVFVEGTAPTEVAPTDGEVTTDTVVTDEYQD
ncbi:MAG: PBP1A family penicillin-binding protein [Myxococcales bacterium]|nr:PBP1A family penicillin-binding protein [Myxococcales bacterium]